MPEESAKLLSYAALLAVVLFGIKFVLPDVLGRREPPPPQIIRMMPPQRQAPPMQMRTMPIQPRFYQRPLGRPLYMPRYQYSYQIGVRR